MKTQRFPLQPEGSLPSLSTISQNAMENSLLYLGVSKRSKSQEDILFAHSNKKKKFSLLEEGDSPNNFISLFL